MHSMLCRPVSTISMARAAHLHIVGLCHLVQQVQGLVLQGFIRVFQTIDDCHLVIGCILSIDAHNARQSINANVFEVVAAGLEELANGFCGCIAPAAVL